MQAHTPKKCDLCSDATCGRTLRSSIESPVYHTLSLFIPSPNKSGITESELIALLLLLSVMLLPVGEKNRNEWMVKGMQPTSTRNAMPTRVQISAGRYWRKLFFQDKFATARLRGGVGEEIVRLSTLSNISLIFALSTQIYKINIYFLD